MDLRSAARFPNGIATNLAALDIYMQDMRSDPCFGDTEAAETDFDICNALNGSNKDVMFVEDCASRGLVAGVDDNGRNLIFNGDGAHVHPTDAKCQFPACSKGRPGVDPIQKNARNPKRGPGATLPNKSYTKTRTSAKTRLALAKSQAGSG
jgi:hypothetical protein